MIFCHLGLATLLQEYLMFPQNEHDSEEEMLAFCGWNRFKKRGRMTSPSEEISIYQVSNMHT